MVKFMTAVAYSLLLNQFAVSVLLFDILTENLTKSKVREEGYI